MVHSTALNRLPVGKRAYSILLSVSLSLSMSLFGVQAQAQGANVDLNESSERVDEISDEQKRETEGITRVYFAFGADTLKRESQAELRALAEQAMAAPDLTVVIAAHTDNRGWALGNLELSRIRARSVARALMANGIEIARLRAFAFGESQPVAPNSTVEGRRMNRRVEISLKP